MAAGEWRRLLAFLGWRRERMAAGGGRLSVANGGRLRVVAACLSWGRWAGRLGHLLSLISSAHPIGYGSPGSSHRQGGVFFSFSPAPPSRLLFSVCLPWLVPPSPAGGCGGCGMACGGGRAGCLLAFSSPVPLSRSRSFACCYTPRVACVAVPIRGVVGRFTVYFGCLLVGVGVFKYMPLNGIMWLLTGIFGDGVCCSFSALPVASSSSLCPVFRPLSAAVSWR